MSPGNVLSRAPEKTNFDIKIQPKTIDLRYRVGFIPQSLVQRSIV